MLKLLPSLLRAHETCYEIRANGRVFITLSHLKTIKSPLLIYMVFVVITYGDFEVLVTAP